MNKHQAKYQFPSDLHEVDCTVFNEHAEIINPEKTVVIIKTTKKGKPEKKLIYRWCYSDRILREGGRRPKEVNLDSHCEKRARLAKLVIEQLLDEGIEHRLFVRLDGAVEEMENKGVLDAILSSPEEAKEIYVKETQDLISRIRQSRISASQSSYSLARPTAHNKQRALSLLISVAHNLTTSAVDSWALYIQQSIRGEPKAEANLSDQELIECYTLHLIAFEKTASFLLNGEDFPLIIPFSKVGYKDYVYYTHYSNSNQGFRSRSEPWIEHFLYDDNGIYRSRKEKDELIEKSDLDLKQKAQLSSVYRNLIQSKQSWNELSNILIIIRKAVLHFSHCLLANLGAFPTFLEGIPKKNIKPMPNINATRLINSKGRAGGETQNFSFQNKSFGNIFKTYLKLLEHAEKITGHEVEDLLFLTNYKKGKLTSFDSSMMRVKNHLFWPTNAPWVSPIEWREFKSLNTLEASNGNIALSAMIANHTVETSRKKYNSRKFEDSAKQLTPFFDELNNKAKERSFKNPIPAPIVQDGYKIDTGRCTGSEEDKPKQIKGYEVNAPQARCTARMTCFFCAHFGIHANEEDILKLLSIKEYIAIQSHDKSRNIDEHYQKYAPIVARIDTIIEDFRNKNSHCYKLVKHVEELVSRGTLNIYWQNKIDALIDSRSIR